MNCKDCQEVKCNAHGTDRIPSGNYCENYAHTNADRIRSMTDEELAKWIADIYPDCPPGYNCDSSRVTDCCDCWLDWLKKEAGDAQ